MKKAFTLIELIVVFTIIAILATIVFVNLEQAARKGRDTQRKADLSTISVALDTRKTELKAYQTKATNFVTIDTDVIESSYLPIIPKDPDPTQNYEYRSDDGQQFKVRAMSEGMTTSISEADAKKYAGDFYNPVPEYYHYYQISTSATALDY